MGMLDSPHSQSGQIGHWKDRLEHCPECSKDLVQPASYEPLWGDRWLIALECPNCEWQREGVWPHAALRRFEEYLDEVDDKLWDELIAIERRRLEEEITVFAGALASDAILPEDF